MYPLERQPEMENHQAQTSKKHKCSRIASVEGF